MADKEPFPNTTKHSKAPLAKVPPVITIDGPTGSGKGTLGHMLAQHLGWHFLDSGALYRILALVAIREKIAPNDFIALTQQALRLPVKFIEGADKSMQISLDGQDITQAIRSEECGLMASTISVYAEVRAALFDRQRQFRQPPGLVADGRDMGTVVFADAPLKFFLVASAQERANRRYQQLKNKGINVSLSVVLKELEQRDARDQKRLVAPLKPAADAIIIDSTALNIEQVFGQIMTHIEKNRALLSLTDSKEDIN
jgi:cytidylate kinase